MNHKKYLRENPELNTVLSDFMSQVLLHKPDDIFEFAAARFNTIETKDQGHRPVVICGPSGSGKSTLIRMMTEEFKGTFGFSVSHTSRELKSGWWWWRRHGWARVRVRVHAR